MPAEDIDFTLQPLIFTHIPKTAGTTVNSGLRKAFPDQCAFHLHRRSEQELESLAADPALHVYSGHLPYMRAAAAFATTGRRPRYMTVLREPIDRILSAYSYARGTPKEHWHDLASSHDINAFVAAMKKKNPQFLVGKQCRFVCPKGSASAEAAFTSLMDNFALVGLQKDLEGFFLGIETLVGRPLPSPKRRNQSSKRVTQDELDAKTLKILEKATLEDRRLYHKTLEWLET